MDNLARVILPVSQDLDGLCLDVCDDHLNGGDKLLKRNVNRFLPEPESIFKVYKNFGCYLHVELRVSRKFAKSQFAAEGFPFVDVGHSARKAAVHNTKSTSVCDCRFQDSVCVFVPKFVECPEGFVPSFIRLQFLDEVDYVGVHILAAATLDLICKSRFRVGEQKLSRLGFASFDCNSAGVASMIEGGPEISSDIKDSQLDPFINWLGEDNFKGILTSLRVFISSTGPVILAGKSFNRFFDGGQISVGFVN